MRIILSPMMAVNTLHLAFSAAYRRVSMTIRLVRYVGQLEKGCQGK